MVQVIARMLGWQPQARATPSSEPAPLRFSAAELAAISRDTGTPAPVVDLDEMREKNRQRALAIAKRNAAKAAGGSLNG